MSFHNAVSLEDQITLAASVFPDLWAKHKDRPGRAGRTMRRNLRLRALDKVLKDHLRSEGHSCADCGSFDAHKSRCLDESDFYGDAITKPGAICAKWRPQS